MSSFLNKGPINLCYHNPMFLLYIKYQWLSCDFCGGGQARMRKFIEFRRFKWERFLGLTGLTAGGFLSLTALRAEGCGIALRAMSTKSALRDWLTMSYGMISITSISHLRWLSPLWCLTAPPSPPAVSVGRQKESAFMGRLGALLRPTCTSYAGCAQWTIKLRKAIPSLNA